MSSEAFVTLATNDGYALGALVLAESIRQVGTKRSLVVLISNHLSDLIRKTLEISFDEVIVVDELNSNDVEHLNLLSRPELGITFTKINCWLLVQYSKCVFLDADCVVLRSIDDLFEREEFSAAPDAGWPDCFNSGVFVFQPSKDTFNKLMLFASQQNASFDGGDQGLLNAYFSNWATGDISRHLPFTYNVTANAFYSYLPAVTRFRNDIHVVHFAGALKPWQLTFNPQSEQLSGNLGGQSDIQRDFLLSWWRVMHQHVWPNINQINQQSNANNKTNSGEGQFGGSLVGSLNYGNLTDNKGIEVGSAAHRRAWELGHIDYYGRDSFDNIQQQLERNIQQNSFEYHPSQQKQISPDKTTNILKSSFKETTPPPVQQTTTTTTLSTTVVKTSLKETTFPSEDLSKQPTTVFSQNVTNLPTKTTIQTTNVSDHLSKQSTNTLKSSLKETTSNVTPSVLKEPTTILKSSLKESTPLSQQKPTTVISQNVTKLPTTTTTLHSSVKEPTTTSKVSSNVLTQSTVAAPPTTSKVSSNVLTQSAAAAAAPTTSKVSSNVLTQSAAAAPTNPLKSSLKVSTASSEESTTKGSQSILKETTPLQTNLLKSSLKETTSHPQTLGSSIRSNENKTPPLTEHESSWTVKSTIVTAYTQGTGELTGPTVVSKSVSETSATSSSDIPVKTAIKQITDPTKSSGLNLTAKTSSDHFTWLFNKIFVAITYTISLCYLLFLVAIRRSKNANISHGNGASVRGVQPSTNNGNRVNK